MSSLIDIIYGADEGEETVARFDKWLVEVGAELAANTPIAELETDKVQLEISAPEAGVLHELLVEIGQELVPGAVLARIKVERDTDSKAADQSLSNDPVDVVFLAEEQEGAEAKISRWLVAVGDTLAADSPMLEVETDKVALEVVAPINGVVLELLADPGADVLPGAIVARLRPAGDAPAVSPGDQAPATATAEDKDDGTARHRLSPSVRRLMTEHDVDVSQITGSGEGGRVRRRDVLAWLADQPTEPEAARYVGEVPSHSVPHTPMRRSIAKHMVDSLLHTSPHVTSVFEVDLGRVIDHRKSNKTDFAAKGVHLTFTAYFLSASATALKAVPQVNARYHDDALEVFEDINIGVGTAMQAQGLIVPVVPRVQTMNLFEIARALHYKTERGRAGKLTREDLAGGTFTISNHGVSGSLFAAPIIINQPQVAILGVGKMEKRVKVVEIDGEDTTRIRPMCYVTLSIDHRALDAFVTNHWLSVFVETLENWPLD
jgi:2-oxoglutarate dehydrogenase E2 component (dihydrolipoamide succinyltransferase)